jgi:MYXO-CTERM domain-containing protein
MKKQIHTILVAGAIAAAGSMAQGGVIAAWDFQTTTTGGTAAVTSASSGVTNTTPKVYVSNFGSGTLYLDGSNGSSNFYLPATGGSNAEINGFGGTSVNADTSIGMSTYAGGPAALAIAGGASTGGVYSANGKSMVFKFSMTGLSGLSISYATQRTGTGFTSQVLEYSSNGSTWFSIGSNTSIQSSFSATSTPPGVATTFSGITGLDGAATAYVRITLSGATASSGNNRFDNFVFSANAVPAPGAAALIGLAGLVTSRRRK